MSTILYLRYTKDAVASRYSMSVVAILNANVDKETGYASTKSIDIFVL